MPNSPRQSRVITSKTYNISVVGFPRAGKSCLCNRFALPHPDFYRHDHIDVLNPLNFQSEIMNCENWLYWGCVSRQVDEFPVRFRIIEYTTFNIGPDFPSDEKYISETYLEYIHRCQTK